jgi:class 3 adenylate cyclase
VGLGAPSGTVTFLFTDIEGSTRLWETAPDAMRVALERHDTMLRSVIEAHGGYVFATGGDGFAAAFGRAGDALTAAVTGQHDLRQESWSADTPIRVRMGVHTGEAAERSGDYFGPRITSFTGGD